MQTLQKVKDITVQRKYIEEFEDADVVSLYTAYNIVGTEEGRDVKSFIQNCRNPKLNMLLWNKM